MSEGKLPSEVKSRPLNKNEVAEELEQARSLLSSQHFYLPSWEQGNIRWANGCDDAEINNERTIQDIIETFDDYDQKLSKILSTIDRILSELPKAIEE